MLPSKLFRCLIFVVLLWLKRPASLFSEWKIIASRGRSCRVGWAGERPVVSSSAGLPLESPMNRTGFLLDYYSPWKSVKPARCLLPYVP